MAKKILPTDIETDNISKKSHELIIIAATFATEKVKGLKLLC